MIILTAKNLSLEFGVALIFNDVSFRIKDDAKIGLVGSNGAGKTSLLKIIANLIENTSGSIIKGDNLRINYLSQISDYISSETVFSQVMSVFDDVYAIEKQMRKIEHDMAFADEKTLHELSLEYTRLTDAFEDADGYAIERNARTVLSGLNVKEDMYERAVSTLSGGQRSRVALARALLSKPDLLLLDEPTNHLDIDAVSFLEDYLSQYSASYIVVSHDRYFMDKVCRQIFELTMGKLNTYNGNYSSYMDQRDIIYEQRMKEYELNQTYIKHEEAIIARFRIWGREKSLKAAKSREKRLETVEIVDRPKNEALVRFKFQVSRRSGNDVLMCEKLAKSFNDKQIFHDINLHIKSGERVALVGTNGIGKTTLLRIFNKQLEADSGAFIVGVGVNIGYYDQHQQNLRQDYTVMDEVWDTFRSLSHQQVRDTLALFLFRGDDIEKKVSELSGGERARLSLLKLMLSKANFLILDEPTNHLDMNSREVLENALSEFPGTLLFVSHDRYFINTIADRVLHMDSSEMTSYKGNWDDYLEHIKMRKAKDAAEPAMSKTERSRQYKQAREKQNILNDKRNQLQNIELMIERLEEELYNVEESLSDVENLSAKEILELGVKHEELTNKINEYITKWEEHGIK